MNGAEGKFSRNSHLFNCRHAKMSLYPCVNLKKIDVTMIENALTEVYIIMIHIIFTILGYELETCELLSRVFRVGALSNF